MSVDIGESLMQSWLRHVKKCDIVQTNWKASMNTGFFPNKAEELLTKMRDSGKFSFLDTKINATSIIRQIEIDALGCMVSNKMFYAGEIAFHEDGLHYKSKDSVPSKMLRIILCLYGYLHAEKACVIFATPYIKNELEKKTLEEFVLTLNDFIKDFGLDYHVYLYANSEFETNILNPVSFLVDKIKDTSEAFVRACQLIKTTKSIGRIEQYRNRKYVKTEYGIIDVTELKKPELIETFIIPILGELSKTKLAPFFEKEISKQEFGIPYPFLSDTCDIYSGKPKYYAESYYLNKTNKNVFISNHCSPDALITWINNYFEKNNTKKD